MSNLNELMERREEINGYIKGLSKGQEILNQEMHKAIEAKDYTWLEALAEQANLQQRLLTIMLEQNVTLEEAEAIIEAQKEQAA